jgi:hypothetical protein
MIDSAGRAAKMGAKLAEDQEAEVQILNKICEDRLEQIADLQRQLDEARATIEREQRPWRVVLCYDDGDHPFCREPLEVVDVGVSDRVYVVESQMLANIQQELDDAREDKARLENEYLTLTANTIESHEKQLAQLQQENGRLRDALEAADAVIASGGCQDNCLRRSCNTCRYSKADGAYRKAKAALSSQDGKQGGSE